MIEQLQGLAHEISKLTSAIAGAAAHKHETETVLKRIEKMENKIMSAITDWAAKEDADLTAISGKLDDVVSGVAVLNKMIADFQNSPGTLSPADQKALDDIQAKSTALVAKAEAISVTPPPGPLP